MRSLIHAPADGRLARSTEQARPSARGLTLLGLSGLAVLVAACTSDHTDNAETQGAAHTAGELTWSNEPYQWAQVPAKALDDPEKKSVPATNPLTSRLQKWVDLLDGEVRKVVQEKTGQALAAPKPEVRLIVDVEPNAFIMPYPACLAQASSPAPGAVPQVIFFTPSKYQKFSQDDCLSDAPNWPTSGGLSYLKGLALQAGISLEQTPGAIKINDHGTLIDALKVSTFTGLSVVNVNLGLLPALSEKSVAAVLAHELGHYYRGHAATANRARYDFWYDRDDHLPARPVPAADQQAYRNEYERLKVPRFLIPNQTIHARVSSTLVAWATELQPAAGHVCEAVKTAVAGWSSTIRTELTVDSSNDLSGEARRKYLALEKAFEPCIAALELTSDAPSTDPWTSNKVSREWFASRIAQPLRGEVSSEELASVTKLTGLVDLLTTKGKALDAAGPAFLQRLVDNKIGLYTAEQEADDVSLELSTRLGLTPSDVFQGSLDLLRFIEKFASPDQLDQFAGYVNAAECEALLKAGFRKDGQLVHVPLGSLKDPHHAQCYRVFNLYRESEAHQYRQAAENFPAANPAWTDLQKQAVAILKGGPIVPGTDPSKPGKPGSPGTTAPGDDGELEGGDGATSSSSSSSGGAKKGETTVTTITKTSCSAAPSDTSTSSGALFGLGAALAALLGRRRRR